MKQDQLILAENLSSFTTTTSKLKEMQWTFFNMYKPFLATQIAQYLAHEQHC